MVDRFSCGSRGTRFARGALRLAAITVAAVAILTLATARESHAFPSADTSAALESVAVSAVVGNLKCCDVGSQHWSSMPCSGGICSTCWTAIAIVGVAFISLDDFAEHVLLRDINFLPTKQTPKFRPPCILA